MHKIQRQLHTDHHHLHKLLNCLSHEIGCYDFDSKRAPDLAIILSALDYVRTYPDKWHHPSEDIIFNRLLKKKVKESKLIKQLQIEHEKIILETKKINELFNSVAEDCIVSADELLTGARQYIALQKQHLDKENEFVYPLMDTEFSEKEWHEIENEVKMQDDPLFNNRSKKEYDQLYRYILDLEKEKCQNI
ncbi:MAG: hemerythrin domain-containing protein [Burkholderiales bacterium]|nr:hemerythrin domain-containing protein [Nitrosomonas sp.]MCP5275041.1 hemerythrin domain-containing protein [Burkholderiales bacterium]